MKLLINADDFGLSHEVNLAITEAFQKGLITNTTIMVNMPGFEEAVALAKEHGFFDRVGLHLNLYEGTPLTGAIKSDPYFSDQGTLTSYTMLHTAGTRAKFFLPKPTTRAIAEEASAQMQKYVEAGFPEMHMDSHGHAHTIYSVYRAILPEMKRFGFRTVRKSLNLYSIRRNPLVVLYKDGYNHLLTCSFRSTDYFTSVPEFLEGDHSGLTDNSICELMVHPGYENGVLVNLGVSPLKELSSIINTTPCISFRDISSNL